MLDNPPCRRAVGDVATRALWHARVQYRDHATVTSPDERAGVAVLREVSRHLVEVVHGDLRGLDTELIAKIGLQHGVASGRQASGATVFSNDVEGVSIVAKAVGSSKKLGRESLANLEAEIGGELQPGLVGPEHGVKFVGGPFRA